MSIFNDIAKGFSDAGRGLGNLIQDTVFDPINSVLDPTFQSLDNIVNGVLFGRNAKDAANRQLAADEQARLDLETEEQLQKRRKKEAALLSDMLRQQQDLRNNPMESRMPAVKSAASMEENDAQMISRGML